jgi:hypothetical protein
MFKVVPEFDLQLKEKFALEQVMKTQRGSRPIAVLFL